MEILYTQHHHIIFHDRLCNYIWYNRRGKRHKSLSISKFSEKDRETVNEAIEFFPGRIERDEWIAQAKELVYTGGKDSEVLDNIRKRKHRINYDRIGIAHKEDAQDLTAIHGIGGWIPEKLYALDIFTYEPISRFSEEDVNSVTEIREFFPGRIERDKWVSQAKELLT